MSNTQRGTITIHIGERQLTLKPTLKAARKIEDEFGGLAKAYGAVQGIHIGHTASVIAAGAGISSPQEREALAEQIFREGVQPISRQVLPYLNWLANPDMGEPEEDRQRGKPDGPSA